MLQVLNPLKWKCIYSVLNYFFFYARGAETAGRPASTFARRLHVGKLLGFPWERSVSSPIVKFLPLPKYAYSLKPIFGAKLVTAYLV